MTNFVFPKINIRLLLYFIRRGKSATGKVQIEIFLPKTGLWVFLHVYRGRGGGLRSLLVWEVGDNT